MSNLGKFVFKTSPWKQTKVFKPHEHSACRDKRRSRGLRPPDTVLASLALASLASLFFNPAKKNKQNLFFGSTKTYLWSVDSTFLTCLQYCFWDKTYGFHVQYVFLYCFCWVLLFFVFFSHYELVELVSHRYWNDGASFRPCSPPSVEHFVSQHIRWPVMLDAQS